MVFRAGHKTRWQFLLAVTAVAVVAAPSLVMAAGDKPYAGDLGQGIAALLIFVLLLVLLGKYAWKPVIDQLKRREEDLKNTIDKAKDREAKADELLQEYQERMDNVDAEAEQVLLDARRAAETERQEMLDKAKADARAMIDQAEEDVKTTQAEAEKNLQAAAAEMATEIAQQVLRRNITDTDHLNLFDQAARDIAESAGDEA